MARRYFHHLDKVGAVAGGGQQATSGEDLIARAGVEAVRRVHPVLHRLQPHRRHLRVQLLRPRLGEQVRVEVPTAGLEVEAVDVAAGCSLKLVEEGEQ